MSQSLGSEQEELQLTLLTVSPLSIDEWAFERLIATDLCWLGAAASGWVMSLLFWSTFCALNFCVFAFVEILYQIFGIYQAQKLVQVLRTAI